MLVVRQKDGGIKALLNSCRHRGTPVCRADCGKAMSFTCTYHGWTYDLSGKLVGVPHLEDGYRSRLDLSRWGLVEVAQVQSYKGLIFGAWDEQAPSLPEYLGDMGWYLDGFLDRRETGTEVVGGVQKYRVQCNWKFGAENSANDMYHANFTHASAVAAVMATQPAEKAMPRKPFAAGDGVQVSFPGGHGTGFFEAPIMQKLQSRGFSKTMRAYKEQTLEESIKRLGEKRTVRHGDGTLDDISKLLLPGRT